MTLQTDHMLDQSGDAGHSRRRLFSAAKGLAVAVLALLIGFIWFVSQVPSSEKPPLRNADGIVVLTGGSSRVSDAFELLAAGFGKRLLISGVHPTNAPSDIGRSVPEGQALLSCCVDLDRSAVNTRSNATETRRWVKERGFRSLIVVTSNYHLPRAILELSHALPDVELIAFPVIGDKWQDEPWWTSGAALRLLLSEYVKFVAAEVRVMIFDPLYGESGEAAGPPPAPGTAKKPATAIAY